MPPSSGDSISRRVQEHNIAMPGVIDRSAGESTARRLSRFGVGDGRLAERVRGRWIMAKEPGVQATDLPFVRGKFVSDLPGSAIVDPSPENGPGKGPTNAPEPQRLQVVTGRRVSGQSVTGQSPAGHSMHESASGLSAAASPGVMRSHTGSSGTEGPGSSSANEFTTQAGAEADPPPGVPSAEGTTPGDNSYQSVAPTALTTNQASSGGQSGTGGDVVQRVGTDQLLSRELGDPAPTSLPFVRPTIDAATAGQADMPADTLQRETAETSLPGVPGAPTATSLPLVHQAPGVARQPDAPANALQQVSAEQPLAGHAGDPATTSLQFVRNAPDTVNLTTPGVPANVPQPTTSATLASSTGSGPTTTAAASASSAGVSSSSASLPVVRAQRRAERTADQVTMPGTPVGDTLGARSADLVSVQRPVEPGAATEGFHGATQPALRSTSARSNMPVADSQGSRSAPGAALQQLSPQTQMASADHIASRAMRWGTPIVQRRATTPGQSATAGTDGAQSAQPSTASRQGAEGVPFSHTAAMPVGTIGRSVEPAQDKPSSPIVHAAARPSVVKLAAPEASNLDMAASGMSYATGTPSAANAASLLEGAKGSEGPGLPAPIVQRVISASTEPGGQVVAASLPLLAPTKETAAAYAEATHVTAGSTGTETGVTGSVQASRLEDAGHSQTQIGKQADAAAPHLRVQRAESAAASPYAGLPNTGIPHTARLSTVPGQGTGVARAAESRIPRPCGGAATATTSGTAASSSPQGESIAARIRHAPAPVSNVVSRTVSDNTGTVVSAPALRAKQYSASRSSGLPISAAVQPGQPGSGHGDSEISPYRTTDLLQAQPEPSVQGELSSTGTSISGGIDTPLPLRRETAAGKAAGFEELAGQIGADGGAGGTFRPPPMAVAAAVVGHTGTDGIARVQRQPSASASASPAPSSSSASTAPAAAAPPSGAAQGAQGTALDDLDLERVATAVYGIIRDRLIIERESKGL